MSNNMTRSKKRKHHQNDLMREKKRQERRMSDWSKLCGDVLQRILESLNLIDFNQTKTVCSHWYSVWRTCMKPPQYPWQIRREGSSIVLFDPKEGKSYDTKVLGLDLTDNSHCMASSGNWLLMVDSRIDCYLVNVLTRERINLPSIESSICCGKIRFRYSTREVGGGYLRRGKKTVGTVNIFSDKHHSILSVNEETGDYFIGLVFSRTYLFTYKKGDNSWRNLNTKETDSMSILDLAYRNNKLYLLTPRNHINMLDFSGDYPREDTDENPYWNHPFNMWWNDLKETKIAIRNSGELLIITSHDNGINRSGIKRFSVFEMNHESKKWVATESVGDNEMLIYGHGVTIKAPVKEVGYGFKSDSIYFAEDQFCIRPFCCGVFDIATCRLLPTHKESGLSSRPRWFVPGFP